MPLLRLKDGGTAGPKGKVSQMRVPVKRDIVPLLWIAKTSFLISFRFSL